MGNSGLVFPLSIFFPLLPFALPETGPGDLLQPLIFLHDKSISL
jgi:hypothetical protein